jgi:hypothetical protein
MSRVGSRRSGRVWLLRLAVTTGAGEGRRWRVLVHRDLRCDRGGYVRGWAEDLSGAGQAGQAGQSRARQCRLWIDAGQGDPIRATCAGRCVQRLPVMRCDAVVLGGLRP